MAELNDRVREARELTHGVLARLRRATDGTSDSLLQDLTAARANAEALAKKLNRVAHLVRVRPAAKLDAAAKDDPFPPARGNMAKIARQIVANKVTPRFSTGDIIESAVRHYGVSRVRDLDKVRLALYHLERRGIIRRVGLRKKGGIQWEITKQEETCQPSPITEPSL